MVGAPNQFAPYPNLHYAFSGDFFKYMAYPNQDDGSFDIHDLDGNQLCFGMESKQ